MKLYMKKVNGQKLKLKNMNEISNRKNSIIHIKKCNKKQNTLMKIYNI